MSAFFPPLLPTLDAALRDVRSRNPRARALAAESLASVPPGDEARAGDAALSLVNDPVGPVRYAAIAALGHLRHEPAFDAVIAHIEDAEAPVREVALIAAAQIGGERAIEAVRAALGDRRPEVRFQAAVSFAELCPSEAPEALAPLARDPDANVRANVASALGIASAPRAAAVLVEMLTDEVPAVRRDAALSLAKHGDAAAVPLLCEALGDPERALDAACALGELDDERAVEPLADVASRLLKPLALRAAAGASLVRLGDARGVVALRDVLRAWRPDARSYATELVGELGVVELAGDVARLAKRPRGADSVVVARALALLAPKAREAAGALQAIANRRDEPGAIARAALDRLATAKA